MNRRVFYRRCFTLVELLVVIAIIGVLVALLLPAVQAARESARMRQCSSHVKQMALGFMNHESVHKFLPTGGWGYYWFGEPQRGYDKGQPGGWAYNLLPFVEQQNLRSLGNGMVQSPQRRQLLIQVAGTTLPIFNCPSKRPVQTYPIAARHKYVAFNLPECNSNTNCMVFRGDYIASSGNGGDRSYIKPTGPDDISWYDMESWSATAPDDFELQTGVCFARSMIRFKHIGDGTSRTIMLGEKYLDPTHYLDGEAGNNDQCLFVGRDIDTNGYTNSGYNPVKPNDFSGAMPPQRDLPPDDGNKRHYYYGSAHVGGVNVAYCDGSVHLEAFDVDAKAWTLLGGRSDE